MAGWLLYGCAVLVDVRLDLPDGSRARHRRCPGAGRGLEARRCDLTRAAVAGIGRHRLHRCRHRRRRIRRFHRLGRDSSSSWPSSPTTYWAWASATVSRPPAASIHRPDARSPSRSACRTPVSPRPWPPRTSPPWPHSPEPCSASGTTSPAHSWPRCSHVSPYSKPPREQLAQDARAQESSAMTESATPAGFSASSRRRSPLATGSSCVLARPQTDVPQLVSLLRDDALEPVARGRVQIGGCRLPARLRSHRLRPQSASGRSRRWSPTIPRSPTAPTVPRTLRGRTVTAFANGVDCSRGALCS